ncbi:hypothetical protein D9756_009229 [Leucocoprinus leucothites]|uniref:BTB domain-containing protein n=1 Tax=Leucocoprinus leucothites TaxID=201217 RepID=A0A8H5FV89_9AGAR|nr:hypothetical protein D9756_009229 [Leucoagaricus leucothites]
MAEGFGENVAPTAAIRAILGSYPFSIGLLRELLQNSDDAKATKQVFVLDRRIHGSTSIYHKYLTETQGPALLAYNDELIQDEDWSALQNIHRSSKIADTSKIGKYGIGFRSCYHITDTPHILSGPYLALLDPQHDFAEFMGVKLGGVKLNIVKDREQYRDHLSSFNAFSSDLEMDLPFNGSIFRLPLRKSPSQIGNRPIQPDEISKLLKDFALEELNVALLFLRHVTSVEIYEINVDGNRSEIASATIDRSPLEPNGQYQTQKSTIRTRFPDRLEEREWRILHAPFSEEEAVAALAERLGGNPTTTLSQHKLVPTINLAIPLNAPGLTEIGRLFTFLPLPLKTKFPVHIHALFSLTQSRQNLRNGGEVGIVKGSDDHALIEWNQLLFNTYIPQAWAILLETLVQRDQITDISDAWPILQADVHSGDYVYWKGMPSNVAKYAIGLSIWPFYGRGSPAYGRAESFLFAESSTANETLDVLARTGLAITQPPQYITQTVVDAFPAKIRKLSPKATHAELLKLIHELANLGDADTDLILAYLLSTLDCSFIIGLPLVPSVASSRVFLSARSSFRSPLSSHILLDETEENLFGVYDPGAISLRRMTPSTRRVLLNHGLSILNVKAFDSMQAVTYLETSHYATEHSGVPESSQVDWLNQFWTYAEELGWYLGHFNSFFMVPTTRGLRRRTDTLFNTEDEPSIAKLLEKLGIVLLDPRMKPRARQAFKNLSPISDIHNLLRALPSNIDADFTADEANQLSEFFIRHLSSSTFKHGAISTGTTLCSRLRSIPMYPLLSYTPEGQSSYTISSISSLYTVLGLDPIAIPVIPQVPSTVWINVRVMGREILQHLDSKHPSPVSASELQELMLKHFQSQSPETQLHFVQDLVSNPFSVSRGVLTRLASISFVFARDGKQRAPKDLVDPDSSIVELFTESLSYLPDTSQPASRTLVKHLRSLDLFISELSLEILCERIRYISTHQASDLAKTVINFIDRHRFDCRDLFNSSLSRDLKWIPTSTGLESPLSCRDASSHYGKTHLFDEVMPMVNGDVPIGYYLRKAFLWDVEVPFSVLKQQLSKVLDQLEPQFEKVYDIIKHIGYRSNLRSFELPETRELLKDKNWVPTRKRTLVATSFVLLNGEDIPSVGFHATYFDSRMHEFLRKMGCADWPSKQTILDQLQYLYTSTAGSMADRHVISGVIRLLSWLPQLDPTERISLIIPDTQGTLRPFEMICYNDVGSRACLVDVGNNFLAHPEISDSLAERLALRRLGLINSGNSVDDELDMGEDFVTTIRNRLREYTDSQLLLEFLANASDAGATEFNILLDEKVSPTNALISSHCRSFQDVPALVVHNNSVFTNDDFIGILRTGIGGKSGKMDSIGQFGLGALTMFHVTELAMIVSGDQVLFLNPCKAHLSVERVALRRPLSVVRRLYADHLTPLIGVFDFNPPKDPTQEYSYNGTLFRLPIRTSAQFSSCEPIFKKVASLHNLASTFEAVASKCLLFTSIDSISCYERRYGPITKSWSISASRSEITNINDRITSHTVSVIAPPHRNGQDWRILSLVVDESQLPPSISSLQEQYRLRTPLVVHIAAACSTPGPSHNLFSTLPLPIPLDLPVHLSGPFILASDRRSIRLDEYENKEAIYNRWLFTSIIPTLWLHLLADRASSSENVVYWPGNTRVVLSDKYNVISRMIMDAFYQIAVGSELCILKSSYHSAVLSPGTAHFMYNLPRSVVKVLDAIRPSDAAELPSSVIRRLKLSSKDSTLSIVSPKYLHDQILLNSTQFTAENLERNELHELIKFLLGDPTYSQFECLDGLRILPVEDGSFATFTAISHSHSHFFVAPREAYEEPVFRPSRMITDADIHSLIEDYVPQLSSLEETEARTRNWIKAFWKVFPLLKISVSAITSYPLIPTLTPGRYLSLTHCKTSVTIIADFNRQNLLIDCLSQMGFKLIDEACLLEEVRSVLVSEDLSIECVLSKLFNHCPNVSTLFDSLKPESRRRFVSWIRSELSPRRPAFFRSHTNYRQLPLWTSATGSFVSANEVQMLPRDVSIESISPFADTTITAHDSLLESMGNKPPSSIQQILNIPARLDPNLDAAYMTLIPVLLRHTSEPSAGIPVPNSHREIQLSAHSIPPTMICSWQHLDLAQSSHSDSRGNDCVEIFQQAIGCDIKDRAAVLFHIFAEDLPLHANASEEYQWTTLDDLRFIPRNPSPRPIEDVDTTRYITSRARFLPDVVAPSKLVRAEYMAIAWSQRALYNTQPHQRVLMTYQGLSVPTAEEVVDHLVVLATDVASDHPHNSTLLQHLRQTYQWLNEHTDSAEVFLQRCTADGVPLFLNVDDPENISEKWNWKRADHVLLDERTYNRLRGSAGAQQETATDKERLSNLCTSFNGMRKSRICVDVSFICEANFGGDEPLYAHRAYLAAYTEYFREMFSGGFQEAGLASSQEPIAVPVPGYSRPCVKSILDYAYTSQEPVLARTESDIDLALEMITLAHAWSMTELHQVMQRLIVRLKMVDPFNFNHVFATATRVEATA